MKKLILLLALALMMYRCNNMSASGIRYVNDCKIVVIDSCEYIRTSVNDVIYVHKGNCKFCAERRMKEQEELISKIKNNE